MCIRDRQERENLFSVIKEIQRISVEGGAKRDHERPGKCESCSRRQECPDRLTIPVGQ